MAKTDQSEKDLVSDLYDDLELHEIHEARKFDWDGPAIGFSPLPIVLIFLFAVALFWGGIYSINNSGGFEALAYHEAFDPSGPPPAPPPEKSLFEIGQEVYANCVVCHQTNGLGIPGAFPPLAGSEWVLGRPEIVPAIVLHGIFGPIEVMGQSMNSAMPPLGEVLTDKQIAGVATYVRSNAEWGNDAGEVTEEMVANLRAQYGVRAMWTAAELSQAYPE